MGAITCQHRKTPRTSLHERITDMLASSRHSPDTYSPMQCVSLKTSIKRLKTRWFSSGCLSDTEELNPQVREDGPSAIVAALHCLGGKGGTLLSHASSNLRQQFGVPSDDKTWLVMPVPEDCTFASMCLGQESFFFLPTMLKKFT